MTPILPCTVAQSGSANPCCYDSNAGAAEFYTTDFLANISQLSSSTYSKGWTHIVPGDFAAGNSNSALLFYNSSSGLAQFYSTDGQGGISQLSSHTHSNRWKHIVTGHLHSEA